MARIEDIVQKKLLIYQEELRRKRTYYDEVAYKSINISCIGSQSGNHKDLADALLRHEVIQRTRELEIKEEMNNLMNKLEMYYKIWDCFNQLEGTAYQILYELYVEKKLYTATEIDSGLSHKTFEQKRKNAIGDIIRLYYLESWKKQGNSTIHLKKERKKKKVEPKEEFKQLSMFE